ncbi:hypothetical protein F7725_010977 [Dissostichus mawsoni]|uniref:AIG1-type G domain-containing protein n=1 Tax=Dissostichus mawsoni TaxID=36200 RepID=A0A7J5Z7Y6_DISMA|nr:hypothetical protein F7725_010977 [Dissostichus mawsoni]
MVLFTHADQLKGKPIEEFLKESAGLQELVARCNGQYHVFNNEEKDRSQVKELLAKIRNIAEKNGGSHYTNEMFQEAEKLIEEEKQRILKEREEEIRKQEEELEKKIEEKYEQRLREAEADRERLIRVIASQEKEKEEEWKKLKEMQQRLARQEAESNTEIIQQIFELVVKVVKQTNFTSSAQQQTSSSLHHQLWPAQTQRMNQTHTMRRSSGCDGGEDRSWEERHRKTILGKQSFKSEFSPKSLTTVCYKASGEDSGNLWRASRQIQHGSLYPRNLWPDVTASAVFNNEEKDRSQVRELLDKIRNITEKNGGRHYTTDMFQEAERELEEEKQRILKEREEEIRKQEEEIKKRISEKYEKQLWKQRQTVRGSLVSLDDKLLNDLFDKIRNKTEKKERTEMFQRGKVK